LDVSSQWVLFNGDESSQHIKQRETSVFVYVDEQYISARSCNRFFNWKICFSKVLMGAVCLASTLHQDQTYCQKIISLGVIWTSPLTGKSFTGHQASQAQWMISEQRKIALLSVSNREFWRKTSWWTLTAIKNTTFCAKYY